INDTFASRFPRVDGLKKGRYVDTLGRIYEILGAVDCYSCPNTFLITSKRYGTQLLKAIKHCANKDDMFSMQ
ncbi:hypothetical protein PMAYCL1PPCAC_27766, partial [Pristionchus mayeri]